MILRSAEGAHQFTTVSRHKARMPVQPPLRDQRERPLKKFDYDANRGCLDGSLNNAAKRACPYGDHHAILLEECISVSFSSFQGKPLPPAVASVSM